MLDTNSWKAAVALHQTKEPQMSFSSRLEAALTWTVASSVAIFALATAYGLTQFSV
jgi:hypothetical protein